MDKKQLAGAVSVGLLLLALLGWQRGWLEREDPQVTEFRELVAQPPSRESRQAVRTAFEEQTRDMSDGERFDFFEKLAPVFVPLMAQQFERRYDEFMKLSPEEQKRRLDEEIDKMRSRMQAANSGAGGPRGPGGGRPPQLSQAKMEAFQKKMLDWTTPTQRAKFEDGMRRFSERMTERGFEMPQGPGGGFF